MKKTFFKYPFIFFPLLAIGFVLLFGFIVMQLWNSILVDVLHVGALSYGQAIGILILSKILFGGFGPGKGRNNGFARHRMQEKMKNMTPEEREKFKAEIQGRCGTPWIKNEAPQAGSAL